MAKKKSKNLGVIFLSFLLILIGLISLFVYSNYINSKTNTSIDKSVNINYKTYTNTKYNYSIDYPSNWIAREFEDEKAGAAFRPASQPNDYAHEYIKVDLGQRTGNMWGVNFDEYVKSAATSEIQNYNSLASISKIQNGSVTGYVATWMVAPIMGSSGGSASESLPITYFPYSDKSRITVSLGNENYLGIYNQMIKTFKLLNK